jgi:hypothetical protein
MRTPTLRLLLSLPRLVLLVLALVLPAAHAATVPSITLKFDHSTSGFELDGAHRDLPCESCHVDAVFQGTPRDCAACHSRGTRYNATPKPVTHVLSSENCAACHTTTAYLPVVHFEHAEVRGSCTSCHDGVHAAGKPAGHVPTTQPCESCHSTVAWQPAGFDHSGITGGCVGCHDGQTATGRGQSHIASSTTCESCHSTLFWQPAQQVDHAQVSGSCFSCHSGTVAISSGTISGKSANHIPADNACGTCHVSTTTWSQVSFSHAGLAATCQACHDGAHGAIQGKNDTHVPTTSSCESCHDTSSWRPAVTVDHAQVVGTCFNCHNGTVSIGSGPVSAKPATHPPTSNNCENCHATSAWTPANVSHDGITGACSSCHNGTGATGKSPTHMTTTDRCESCHTVVSWVPSDRVDHTQTLGSCVACHGGTLSISTGTVTARPATHIASSSACESCHVTAAWKPVTRVDHTQVTGSCSSCHSGTISLSTGVIAGKPAGHVLTSQECDACHTTVAWTPANFSHNGISGTCVSCHNGTNATGKNPAHMLTSDTCESCHNTVVWRPADRTDHAQIPAAASGSCTGCHNGTLAISTGTVTGKPTDAIHQNVTQECGSCHTTLAWTPAAFDHTGIASGCSGCHNGTAATGKTPTHIATGSTCESCHNTVTWRPATGVDHAQVSGTCYACHSGSLTLSTGTVTGKSPTHIASSNACENCHGTGTWTPATAVDHAQVTGTCVSCHSGSLTLRTGTVTGKSPTHIASSNTCENCHATTAWMPSTTVDHAQLTGSCVSCHSGTVSISTGVITGKPVGHPAADDNCQNCHTTTAWRPANFNHNGITGNCYSCHNGTDAAGKGTQHIASTTSCESCHTVVAWIPAVTVDHTQVSGTCTACHNGATPIGTPPASSGTITSKPADAIHQNTTAQCGTCHTTTAWKPASFDHSGISANCSGCHNGTSATGKTPTHIASSNSCESCHGTAAWKPATRTDHAQVTGTCYACHSGSLAISTGIVAGKNAAHLPTSNLCENCHATSAWKPVSAFDHTQVGVGTCYSCHSGSVLISTGYVSGKNASHIATGNACENCHTSNAWKPAGFDHAAVQPGTCSTCHNNVQATGKPNGHIATTAECDSCHSTLAWTPISFDHAGVTSGCTACHNGDIATGKDAGHFVTARECITCHTATAWTPAAHTHTSLNYPGNHRTALGCTNSACHGGNSEAVTWPASTYVNSCAGCHAGDYRTSPHTKYGTTKYTVSELRNCSGACHVYTDATLSTISRRRNGPEHGVADGGF